MEERRKEPRKIVMAFTPVYDAGKGTILGYLRDLTLRGAMVIGEHSLEVDSRLVLWIQFPGELEGVSAHRVTIPVRVARCLSDEAPASFQVGFEFLQVSPENEKMILSILDRFNFRQQADSQK